MRLLCIILIFNFAAVKWIHAESSVNIFDDFRINFDLNFITQNFCRQDQSKSIMKTTSSWKMANIFDMLVGSFTTFVLCHKLGEINCVHWERPVWMQLPHMLNGLCIIQMTESMFGMESQILNNSFAWLRKKIFTLFWDPVHISAPKEIWYKCFCILIAKL